MAETPTTAGLLTSAKTSTTASTSAAPEAALLCREMKPSALVTVLFMQIPPAENVLYILCHARPGYSAESAEELTFVALCSAR